MRSSKGGGCPALKGRHARLTHSVQCIRVQFHAGCVRLVQSKGAVTQLQNAAPSDLHRDATHKASAVQQVLCCILHRKETTRAFFTVVPFHVFHFRQRGFERNFFLPPVNLFVTRRGRQRKRGQRLEKYPCTGNSQGISGPACLLGLFLLES